MSAVDRPSARPRHSAPSEQSWSARWPLWCTAGFTAAALALALAVRVRIGVAPPAVTALLLALCAAVAAAGLACWAAVAAADRRVVRAAAEVAAAQQAGSRDAAEAQRQTAAAEKSRQQAAEIRFLLGKICTRQLTRISALLEATRALQETEDTGLLKALYVVEHLIVEVRRLAQDGAVVTGSEQTRQWPQPETARRITRLGAQQIQSYLRVDFLPSDDGRIVGRAVSDVIGIVAALLDNATACSPAGRVTVGAQLEQATGQKPALLVEIADRGFGMHPDVLDACNAVLADPFGPVAWKHVMRGQIGLHMAGRRAVRQKITVALEPNPAGSGTRALVRVPGELLITAEPPKPNTGADAAVSPPPPRPLPVPAAVPVQPAAGAATSWPAADGQVQVSGLPPLPTRSLPTFPVAPQRSPAVQDAQIVSSAQAASFWSAAPQPRPRREPEQEQEQTC